MNKKLIIVLISVALLLSLTVGGVFIYLNIYYAADEDAMEAYAPIDAIEPTVGRDGEIAFIPDDIVAGFIFYPGGKVEARAYYPFMQYCAELGILAVLVPMPYNLAVFDSNAAMDVKDNYPDVLRWYIGGHSLGGAMAASCIDSNPYDFGGLVLLGAYSTADISDLDISVLSVYGSEDGVMNREKYEASRVNLPQNFTEIVLEGGNHSGFAVYGEQSGDGAAYIPKSDQMASTAFEIYALMLTI